MTKEIWLPAYLLLFIILVGISITVNDIHMSELSKAASLTLMLGAVKRLHQK